MDSRIGLVLALGLIIFGALFFFNQRQNVVSPQDSAPTNNQGVGGGPPVQTSPTPVTTIKSFEVVGSSFEFTPNEIRVSKGDTVKINFSSQDMSHDFVIDEFNVKSNVLQAGQLESVEFVADKTGTFEYYCSVGNHRQMGMVGKLIVE